ncbi:MAG: hypothetical protein ACI9Y1_001473, partial [Lentisphaeria bacterium]
GELSGVTMLIMGCASGVWELGRIIQEHRLFY